MSRMVMIGAVLAVLGIAGLAIPIFQTQKTEDVAKIGDLKVQTTEHTTHTVPPLLSGGLLALGIILMGAGLVQKRG